MKISDRNCHYKKMNFLLNFKVLLRKMVKKKRKMAFIIIHIISILTIIGLSSKAQLVKSDDVFRANKTHNIGL